MRLFATTVQGIEDVAAEEAERLTGCRAEPDVGKVFLQAPLEAVYRLNLASRTLHRVFIELCRERFETLSDLYRLAYGIDYTEFIDPDQSFAIRSERVGVHSFTSIDVSRIVGQAVIDSYLAARGRRLRVDLDEPDVELYCLVRDDEFIMGVDTTGRSLHRRGYRVYEHPAALKPTIASAMLLLSGWRPGETLIDPMCGGATIPIEAAMMAWNRAPNRGRRDFNLLMLRGFDAETLEEERLRLMEAEEGGLYPIYGLERYAKHLEGGLRNAERAGVLETLTLRLGDATDPASYPEAVSRIVVNPPYGVRMVPRERIRRLYPAFLKALREAASGAKLTLITAAYRRFREAAEEVGVEIISYRRVLHGDLETMIYLCRV
ncbi:class I SAM-dependent RNA methyltransferase [Candidatus Bathyarchaeota archaeon]|nr:MAG: class I SAM-dependent RNA methyltransferase [Candidatus Bathyarchaeota archaeon]